MQLPKALLTRKFQKDLKGYDHLLDDFTQKKKIHSSRGEKTSSFKRRPKLMEEP